MHRAGMWILATDFDAGKKIESGFPRRGARFGDAVDRVVIRQRQRRKAGRRPA